MKFKHAMISFVLCISLTAGFACHAFAEKQPLKLDAKAAILTDVNSGEVLYAYNENKALYPASITKVMSLILIMEAIESKKISLKDMVSASKNAVSYGGSQIWLKEGEKMSVDDLLKAVVVSSANDACTALGEFVSGSSAAFVEQMNQRAKELGMNHTHFENCTGLDENETKHLSTAYDIALMSAELMRHDLITQYSTIWMDSLRNGETMLVNTNKLVRNYDGCIGLKTGTTTKAGFCVSAVAQRDGTRLCAVILGAQNGDERFQSAARLLDYGFANFESAYPRINLSQSGEVEVLGSRKSSVKPTLECEQPVFTVAKGEKNSVETKIVLKQRISAPVAAGSVLGRADFYLGQKHLGSLNIISAESADRLNFWQAFEKLLKSTVR